jgi:hypothetical protein
MRYLLFGEDKSANTVAQLTLVMCYKLLCNLVIFFNDRCKIECYNIFLYESCSLTRL